MAVGDDTLTCLGEMTVRGSMGKKSLSELQQLEVRQVVIVIGKLRQHDALAASTWRIHNKATCPLKQKQFRNIID